MDWYLDHFINGIKVHLMLLELLSQIKV